MNDNVRLFFERYAASAELRARIAEAEAAYPGSLEIREAVAEDVLLPIAAGLGLPFTLKELRAYETKLKMDRSLGLPSAADMPDTGDYWLVDKGWTYDAASFGIAKKEP